MRIRAATISDACNLAPLLGELGYSTTVEEIERRLAVYSPSDKYAVLVAEEESSLFGFVAFSITEQILRPGRRCRIEALLVHTTHRRQGIGRQLILAAEECAKEHGCACVDLTSGVRRAKNGSHDFYRSCGYSDAGPFPKVYFQKQL
jgi:GNAT superfamily N-acetyltransferase